MNSQALYRKWRSQTFDELVGQKAVVDTLKHALSSGSLVHAYLFIGPRGTGKTTTARLLAKTVNCQQPRNGEPCNQCQQCREISAGTSFDVIEIDAASHRGIDHIRELREKVLVRPTSARYKVYVLDEAHMLTTEAFNALLKTLEEPPEYAIFVLATTDVHKMPPTVISRCQCLYFQRFAIRQIVEHLHYIAQQEHITLEPGAAELIARAADGGMRDALSLLDQAIAYAGETITQAQVQAMLGVADPHTVQEFVLAVAEENSAAGLHLIHRLMEQGADLRQVNAQVVEFWRALMLARAGASLEEILDRSTEELREIQALARRFTLEELMGFARICAQNELLQKGLGTPQLALELAFLECVELRRRTRAGEAAATSSLQSIPAAAPRTLPSPLPPSPPSGHPTLSSLATPPAPASTASGQTAPEPGEGAATPGTVQRQPAAPTAAPTAPPAPAASTRATAARGDASSAAGLTLQQVQQAWEMVKRRVKQKDYKTASFLNDFRVVAVEVGAGGPIVVIQAEHQPHYELLNQRNRHKPVEQALELEFGIKCQVRLLAPGQPLIAAPTERTMAQPSPLARRGIVTQNESSSVQSAEARAAAPESDQPLPEKGPEVEPPSPPPPAVLSPEALKAKAGADPRVQEAVKTFGAEIVDIAIDSN
jgi:DNA polymerase-3 subunit gamma/tau